MKTCIHGDQVLAQPLGAEAAVVRDDKADASVGEVTANYLAGFRHEDADDARFAAALTVRAQRLSQHPAAKRASSASSCRKPAR